MTAPRGAGPDPAAPLAVLADFNETLVLERTLPHWCRARLATGPPRRRARAVLATVVWGLAARAADALGLDRLAARLGLRVLAGSEAAELEAWARAALTPNPRAFVALARLARERGTVELVVVSRGSPALAVRAWLARPDVEGRLRALGVRTAGVVAPEMEARGGRLTGRVEGGVPGKRDRARLVPEGGAFLGDARDERWLRRSGARVRFERV